MIPGIVTIFDALGLDPWRAGVALVPAADLLPDTARWLAEPGKPLPPDTAERAWSELQGVGPYTPPLQPFPFVVTRPALVTGLVDAGQFGQVLVALRTRYPADHPIRLVFVAGETLRVVEQTLGAADQQVVPDVIMLPPLALLADTHGAEGAAYVVARLLGPYGCPWDREQTPRSMRGALLEETYETLEALDGDDPEALAEELGDLLLHVLMQAEMGRQAGQFELRDVYAHMTTKLIRRHPHIFAALAVRDSAEVLWNWEAIKQAERAEKQARPRGALDGIPPGLPALAEAQKLTYKAARAGFDAPDSKRAWAKVHEELAELQAAVAQPVRDPAHLEEELGDLLLAIGKLAWKLELDAESALRSAGIKFRRRFAMVEQLAAAQGRTLAAMQVPEKEALWEQAKGQAGHESAD